MFLQEILSSILYTNVLLTTPSNPPPPKKKKGGGGGSFDKLTCSNSETKVQTKLDILPQPQFADARPVLALTMTDVCEGSH